MNSKEEQFNINTQKENNINLLRMGVIFLSIVSFFTTANGMLKYIFINDIVIAYAASGAIQGILLALSMNLPTYLRNIYQSQNCKTEVQTSKRKKIISGIMRFLRNIFLTICTVSLTIVTIFCSSWFSYIYIADIIHMNSWDADSELLVQQTYRTELYNARDYAHNYRIYLEESVGRKILQLDEQTKSLSAPMENFHINWVEEREEYASGNGTAASYMSTVINAMELAMPQDFIGNSSQEERELAATAITDAKTNIERRMEDAQQNLEIFDNNIKNYNDQITGLRNQINRAGVDADNTNLNNSINNYMQLIDETSQKQVELQTEYLQLENALGRLSYYEVQLGLSSSTSAISIRRDLLELQTEFFEMDPDEDRLLDIAGTIFKNLRNAARQTADGDNSEADLSYTSLLVQMNQLLQNLTDYTGIKDIESNLNQLIEEMRLKNSSDIITIEERMPEETDTVSSSDPSETVSSANPTVAGTVSSNDQSNSKSDDPSEEISDNEWQKVWGKKIDELKSQISAMPVYAESVNEENITESILSESQINFLVNYNRDNSSRALDDLIRRYISDHNAIYQGIIYLQSPYRSLALFALLLALSFDLSGFIFGFVVQRDESTEISEADENAQSKTNENSKENVPAVNLPSISNSGEKTVPHIPTGKKWGIHIDWSIRSKKQTAWSIYKTLTPYIVLTGDYQCQNGIYYYKTFKDGVLYQWVVQDNIVYTQGIYIQKDTDKEQAIGLTLPENDQELLFARQSEKPKDGIYRNCQLIYDEGSLILYKDNQQIYLAGIDEYVPVHCYNPNQGENKTIPSKELAMKADNDQVVVVALNTKGTKIVAIYIIEHA